MTLPLPPSTPRRPRPPSPEFIGGAVAVLIIVVVATTALAAGPSSGGPSAPDDGSSRPSLAVQSGAPTPTPVVNPAVVNILGILNEQLAAGAEALEAERTRVNLRIREVQSLIRQVNTRVLAGIDAVGGLRGAMGRDEPGAKIAELYATIEATATKTLRASVLNEDEYRRGAGALIQLIGQLPALQAQLEALAQPPTPAPSSAAPSATASPKPSSTPPPTTAPTRTPTGTASASPTMPGPAGDEQIVNGGFESGVGQPWGLFLGQGAAATLTTDPERPGAGQASARVDITSGSLAYSGISLRQRGLRLEAGRLYTLSLAVRAEAGREIRVRIASTSGAQYFGRIVSVSGDWSTQSFVFTAGVGDPNAVLELDLGRAQQTTWFDAVSFRPLGP